LEDIMPELKRVLSEAELKEARAPVSVDLTPYFEILSKVLESGGAGGEIELQPGEQQRTEKRRFTIAAKQRNLRLVWRRAPEGMLRFVLASIGKPVPGGRQRKPKKAAAS
jgi:hypothetical protein